MLQEQSRDLAKLMMHRASAPTTKPSIVANAAEATTPQTLPSVMEHCSSPKKGGLVKAGSGCLDDAEASPKSAEGLSSGAEQHDISPLHPPPPMELQARESAVCATPIAVAAGATLTDQKEQQQQYHLLPATVALPAEVVHPAVVETTLMEERKHLEGLRDTLEDVRRLYITLRCARRNIPEALPNKDNDDDDNNNHKNANASKNNKNTNNNYTPLSPRKSTVLTVETYPETRADNADADGAAKE
ncbi:hypothetical protein DQ04_07731000 [Trypanosoma grayi]|uniref:hypothetical protein n=1 Tax=Trypanosoma grayi TaxID=71804 RepID=UPI0004F42ABB|nr:hypothetical protein DQ04_07731000 [Trypanosoma grayi]KEG08208.1 hypothetical protein DQ04_07731000 [Trypanosoma grayi]